jgi:hypothetical protein
MTFLKVDNNPGLGLEKSGFLCYNIGVNIRVLAMVV